MTDDFEVGSILQDDAAETGRLIRPYAITGGRTGSDDDVIGLEAQIQANTRASSNVGAYRWEAAKLIALVQAPTALVEVAARLEIPIGVARVLIADLVRDGAVVVHVPQRSKSFTSVLEKVLDGVRGL